MPVRVDVMLIVDPRQPGALEGLARIGDVVSGDRLAVQLRMKDATDAERIAASRALAAVMPADARLLVNASLAVARAIAADGVHLPEGAGTIDEARAHLARGACVSASCHDEAGVRRRAGEGADFVVLGPLGDVPGKPAMRVDDFRAAVSAVHVPVLALGGIATIDDVQRARSMGARGVALQRAVLEASGPRLVRDALRAFD